MKRLFQVNGVFFDNKQAAKAARGKKTQPARTEQNRTMPPVYEFEVHLGPDHIGYHGHTVPTTRRRAPQQVQPKREGPRVRRKDR